MIHIEVVAKIFGVHVLVVRFWVKKNHLDALGPVGKKKWLKFATAYIFELCDDITWLRKARALEVEFWELKQNSERRAKRPQNRNGRCEMEVERQPK
ncbi:MAG: hypothetical protein ACREIC_20385 [Limisphaerales bacterium]